MYIHAKCIKFNESSSLSSPLDKDKHATPYPLGSYFFLYIFVLEKLFKIAFNVGSEGTSTPNSVKSLTL